MATVLRVLLWTAVVVAPGGVLLLPFLAAGELRRREQKAGPRSPGALSVAAPI